MVLEVGAFESLSEAPVGGSCVVGDGDRAIASDGFEGQGLAVHAAVACELPHLAPVAVHGLPVGVGALHIQLLHIPCSGHIGHQNEQEVGVSIDGEPHASRFHTRHSAINYSNQHKNSSLVNTNNTPKLLNNHSKQHLRIHYSCFFNSIDPTYIS